MMRGEKTILVLTDLTITPPDGSTARPDDPVRVPPGRPREAEAEERRRSREFPNGKMRVLAVSPNDGAVVLRLTGVSKNPADEFQAATVESLSVDVTHKPLIALVWGGFYVLMAGGLLAFVKRSQEARRAVLEAAPEAQPARRDVPVAPDRARPCRPTRARRSAEAIPARVTGPPLRPHLELEPVVRPP